MITSETPLVGIIMGSESDMPTMEACMKQLDELGIPYEVKVASAHRKPAVVHEWASSAVDRGIRVIIAAAGKAAHLGGVVAAYTPLPVIAVPMKTSDLGGLDSLLSMVQMPSGVPVATVAINGAKNAAILAVQMLGTGDEEARAKIEEQIAAEGITEPKNLEEQALSLVGRDIFEKLVKEYTEKQWGRGIPEHLPLR